MEEPSFTSTKVRPLASRLVRTQPWMVVLWPGSPLCRMSRMRGMVVLVVRDLVGLLPILTYDRAMGL